MRWSRRWPARSTPGAAETVEPGRRPEPSGRRRRGALVAAFGLLAIGLGACGGAVAGGARATTLARTTGSPLVIADLAPFSGVDAALGPIYDASCLAATHAINRAGGVLGHPLTCATFDTRGDPADAVPATRQMFATTPNLVLVIGVTSDEAAAVVPAINARHVVVFGMTGQSEFDHIHFPYFFRLVPPDLEEAYALVAIAHFREHFHRIGVAFGNDIGSQTFVQPALNAIRKGGMVVAGNETLNLSASSYRTEAAKIIEAHPQVILTEALGAADATFISEVRQLNHGKMIPIIGTSATISPAWFKAVASAVGGSNLSRNFLADNLVIDTSGAAYRVFVRSMEAIKSQVTKVGVFSTLFSAPGAVHLYDGMNLASLAMVMSHSTKPSVYKADILKIGDGVPGAVVVHSFAQGLAELKAGKAIRYVGPGGPTNFDSYHDSTGIFQIDSYSPQGVVRVVGNIPASQLRALS